jgi:hypothetical protein
VGIPVRAARIAGLLSAAVAFGVLASILQGSGARIRDGLGNLSAPWVIVPMLISAAGSRGRSATVVQGRPDQWAFDGPCRSLGDQEGQAQRSADSGRCDFARAPGRSTPLGRVARPLGRPNGEWDDIYAAEIAVGAIATAALWRARLRRQNRHSM